MHLLLLILLFLHSWRFRGKGVTLAFFSAGSAFGVIRGNLIHYISTVYLGEQSPPYLFTQPVIRLWNVSVQECLGWIFALYLSWSTVEWLLGRESKTGVRIYRLVGLSAFFMGAVAYGAGVAAARLKWLIWIAPIKNPFFVEIPSGEIIAWISIAFDFLAPFLLIYYKVLQSRFRYLLFCLFPLHMLLHLKVRLPGGCRSIPLNYGTG